MLRFARLIEELETRPGSEARAQALGRYWSEAPDSDAGWAAHVLLGGRPTRVLTRAELRAWVSDEAGLDDWLIEASAQGVGDVVETLALLLPTDASPPSGAAHPQADLSTWLGQRLPAWRDLSPQNRRSTWATWSRALPPQARTVLWRLMVGLWRISVPRHEVISSLANHAGVRVAQAAWHLAEVGRKWPDAIQPGLGAMLEGPDPFAPLPPVVQALATWRHLPEGTPPWTAAAWPPGIRVQWVMRGGRSALWSTEEELLNPAFPDVLDALAAFAKVTDMRDDTVLEGVIAAPASIAKADSGWHPDGAQRLAQRLARKEVSTSLCQASPAAFVPVDVLAWAGQDLRSQPAAERWAHVAGQPASTGSLHLPPRWQVGSHDEWSSHLSRALAWGGEALWLQGSGASDVAGLLRPASQRARAVLLYAQADSGRGQAAQGECTFAVWNRPPADEAEMHQVAEAMVRREPARADGLQLVAFARAPLPFGDPERARIEQWVRQHTVERFGPVRVVRPALVFELGFEALDENPRRKSGLATRGLQVLAWHPDSALTEVSNLTKLRQKQFKTV
jgi:DNA ligase-1